MKIEENNGKIICCDDSIATTKVIKALLKNRGFIVKTVNNGLECIKLIKRNDYDLLILDYIMPEMNGDEVLRGIRKFSNIYTIMLTSNSDIVPLVETIKGLDIQGYVEKSDDLSRMILQVETVFKVQQYMREIFFTQNFGEILKMLRLHFRYSQSYVAERIDVHRGTIIDFEKGRSFPSHSIMLKIAGLFNADMNFLYGKLLHNSL